MFTSYEEFVKNIHLFSKYCSFSGDTLHLFIPDKKYKVRSTIAFYFMSNIGEHFWPIHLLGNMFPVYKLNDSYSLQVLYDEIHNIFRYYLTCHKPYMQFNIIDLSAIHMADDILLNKCPPEILLDYSCEKSLPFRQVMVCSELLKKELSTWI